MNIPKETYGQKIIKHQAKNLDLEDDIIEYRKQMERDVMQDIYRTAQTSKTHTLYQNRDFYIVLGFKVQKMGQAVQPLVWARRSCPTPVYKQAVFKYKHITGTLEFLWTIPDKILYYHILQNSHKYMANKETTDIAKFVVLMESGEMEKWVIRENGEKIDAIIKIKKEEPAYG